MQQTSFFCNDALRPSDRLKKLNIPTTVSICRHHQRLILEVFACHAGTLTFAPLGIFCGLRSSDDFWSCSVFTDDTETLSSTRRWRFHMFITYLLKSETEGRKTRLCTLIFGHSTSVATGGFVFQQVSAPVHSQVSFPTLLFHKIV